MFSSWLGSLLKDVAVIHFFSVVEALLDSLSSYRSLHEGWWKWQLVEKTQNVFTRRKAYLNNTFSTTHFTSNYLGMNSGLCG